MNVGDYVRYKTLSNQIKINKIINIVEPSDSELSMTNIILYDLDNKDVTADKYIIKSSTNIIDLIEKSDLVVDNYGNVYAVDYVFDNYIYTTTKQGNIVKTLCDYQIKSIVTREMFESMEYKVGE